MRVGSDTTNSATFTASTGLTILDWIYFASLDGGHFSVRNLDGVNNLNLIMERAGPDKASPEQIFNIPIPPSTMRAVLFGPEMVGFYWRFTAQSDSPGFPSVQGQWRRVMARRD